MMGTNNCAVYSMGLSYKSEAKDIRKPPYIWKLKKVFLNKSYVKNHTGI